MTEQEQARDLVSEITNILIKHNHPNPNSWQAHLPPDAKTHSIERIRRFLINQYWREQLGNIDIAGGNTIGDRFCLIEDGSVEDWLRLFDQKVMKTIMKHKIGF